MITLEELNQALINKKEFKRLIKNSYDLTAVGNNFPNHKDNLIQVLLADPDEFKRVIQDTSNLIAVGNNFPNHKDNLIQVLLADPDEFKRVIQDTSNLIAVGNNFPGHTNILKQASVEEALKIIVKKSDEAHTRGATIGALASGDASKKLPPEISGHISSFLNRKDGARLAQTNKAASEIAKQERDFGKIKPKR
jgi:hypothetical protein